MSDVRKPTGDVEDFWEDLDWDELSPTEQKLFSDLGYTKQSWESDDDVEVPSDDKDWEELSSKELNALTALGYTKAYWES
jgi:hypothetical protein